MVHIMKLEGIPAVFLEMAAVRGGDQEEADAAQAVIIARACIRHGRGKLLGQVQEQRGR